MADNEQRKRDIKAQLDALTAELALLTTEPVAPAVPVAPAEPVAPAVPVAPVASPAREGGGGGGGGAPVADEDDDEDDDEAEEHYGLRNAIGIGGEKIRTSIYRVTNGFATIKDEVPVRVQLEVRCESEKAAYWEVARLCGHNIGNLPEEKQKCFRVSMWERYHKGNYITPYLFKKNCQKRLGKLLPKDGVTHGVVFSELRAPVTSQFVIVIDDHATEDATRRFPWGGKFVLEQ
jgi:hypothetical protein